MGRINSNRFYCTRSASSPSQSSLRDASSPKVGALGSPRKLHLSAKASPFGRGVTVGDGEGEPAEIIRSCRMPLRPLPVKRVHRSVRRRSGVPKKQIIFPLKMPIAARRAFQIVLLKTLPCRGRQRFRPAAPQCAAAGCILPHARCGWVHRS